LLVTVVVSLLLAFFATYILVPLCISLAWATGFIDHPDGKLKVHRKAVPYLGGLAVYVGFLFAYFTVAPDRGAFGIIACATMLFLLGMIDDKWQVKPYQKFLGQLVIAVPFLATTMMQRLPSVVGQLLGVLAFPVKFFISGLWFLTIVNACNLIDVMDGLATLSSLCIAIVLSMCAFVLGLHTLVVLLLALAGALAAFLFFNRPTACIYLGDAGALFVGGVLASASLIIPWMSLSECGYVIPLLIFIIPLLELITLIIVRLYKGIPWYCGSPDHFSIYLQGQGWSKNAILLYCLAFVLLVSFTVFIFITQAVCLKKSCIVGIFLVLLWYVNLLLSGSILKNFMSIWSFFVILFRRLLF
jgi:UDP-GlcNAc:undecaprenyl-phosphate/decaprenyl-phosphate GlcNAc-1-phosphate transferase